MIWNDWGTPETFVSLWFDGDADSGVLEDVPFMDGGLYQLNVAVFSDVGFAYSEYNYFVWDENASNLTD